MSFNDIQINGSPSINNTVDTGYYTNEAGQLVFYSGESRWLTLDTCNLNSSNISQIDSSGGLVIKKSGIYRLSLSIDLLSTTEDHFFDLYFSFSTLSFKEFNSDNRKFHLINQHLIGYTGSNVHLTNIGVDNSNNSIGIVSWQAKGNNIGRQTTNTEGALFVTLDDTSNTPIKPSVIRYFGDTNGLKDVRIGILTTELVFSAKNDEIPLYLAMESTHSISIGNCYFVLQLISTNSI